MSDAKWSYLDAAKQRQGPFSREELIGLASAGTIGANTFVWRSGTKDWLKFSDVNELQMAPPTTPEPVNILTQRLASRQVQSSRPLSARKGAHWSVKYAVVAAVIVGIIAANSVFGFLPTSVGITNSKGFVPARLPSSWSSEDGRDHVSIQCAFRQTGWEPGGRPQYRVQARVCCAENGSRSMRLNTTGKSHVIIRDSSGKEVFNQYVSNYLLCPS